MSDSFDHHLLPGERIVWTGRPSTGIVFRPIDIFLVPFSLLWGGFAIFWNVGVWSAGADVSFSLFGLPFLAVGLYAIFGRFLIDMSMRRQMVYLVTDRRILILRGKDGASSRSLDIRRLPAVDLNERSDGSGTIRFGPSGGWFSNNNFGMWQPTFDPTPQFIAIENARQVYGVIQQLA